MTCDSVSVKEILPFNVYFVCLNCSRDQDRKVSGARLVVLQTFTEIKAV